MNGQIEQKNNLAWKDRPLAELVRLALPIAISTLSYSAMTLIDTLFVGRLGAAALAGVGLGGAVGFSAICFSIGLLRGVKVLVSQAAGSGRTDQARAYLGAGLVLGVALGALTAGLGLALAPLVQAISASAEAGVNAADYLRVRLFGTPMLLVYVAFREARYGVGDARTPMVAAVAANALNIALDYLFIVHLGWGVAGAAWASVFAQVAEALVLFSAQVREGLGLRDFAGRHLLSIARVGLPTGIQFALEVGSFALLAMMLAALGEVEIAAHQIALQVINISFLPAYAIAEACSILIGQAVGADRDDLVWPVARLGMVVAATYNGLCTVVFALASSWIAAQFSADLDLQRRAGELLLVAALFQIADGANVVARGALRGTGDVVIPAIIGIATAWLLTPPLTWILGYHAGMGAVGGWVGLFSEIAFGAALLWWRLGRGSWRQAAAKSRERIDLDGIAMCEEPAGA